METLNKVNSTFVQMAGMPVVSKPEWILVKTNIDDLNKARHVSRLFKSMNQTVEWSLDMGDVDNVIRMRSRSDVSETHIIELLRKRGFHAESL